jgi:hypothetical protein
MSLRQAGTIAPTVYHRKSAGESAFVVLAGILRKLFLQQAFKVRRPKGTAFLNDLKHHILRRTVSAGNLSHRLSPRPILRVELA